MSRFDVYGVYPGWNAAFFQIVMELADGLAIVFVIADEDLVIHGGISPLDLF